MADYTPNPKDIPNYTQSGAQNIDVGKRPASDLLPNIFQTETNKRFLDSTLDQLLSSGSTETINTYWGRISGKSYQPGSDVYNPEHSANRVNYQFAPGIAVTEGDTATSVNTYISLLNNLERHGVDVSNIDAVTSDPSQVLALPINIDMFVNFTKYYWMQDDAPICVINPTSSDPINIDRIIDLSNYTTPVLSNGKTLTFYNGMRVQFTGSNVSSTSGDYAVDNIYFVCGVGTKNIELVLAVNSNGDVEYNHTMPYTPRLPSGWSQEAWDSTLWDYSELKNIIKEYVVMERNATDRNAWARCNQWVSETALLETIAYAELEVTDYLTTENRAVRPIIEFEKDIELFNFGTTPIADVQHLITDVTDPTTQIINQASYTNNDVALVDGDRVLFLNAGSYSNNIYEVSGASIGSLILTEVENNSTFSNGDKVLAIHATLDADNGSELYWGGSWTRGQQKTYRGQSPLFMLYNNEGLEISPNNFVDNDFDGDPIFEYIHNSAGVFDPELGFAPKYNSQNNNNDLEFHFTLGSKRYNLDVGSENAREISGDYYYYKKDTQEYDNCWAPIAGGQRTRLLKTHIVETDAATLNVKIDSSAYDRSKTYAVSLVNGKYDWMIESYTNIDTIGDRNPSLVFVPGESYTIKNAVAHGLEFVDPYGTTVNISVTVTGIDSTVVIDPSYAYSTVYYRNTTDNTINGRIFLNDNNQNTLLVYKNGTRVQDTDYTLASNIITFTNVKENDVIEISYVANEKVVNDIYDVSPGMKYNPTNDVVDVVSFSNLFNHLENQLLGMPGFDGNVFGNNNYGQIPRNHYYGGTIRKQPYSVAKLAQLINSNTTNPFNGLVSVARDYANFKTYFINKIRQLWKTESDKTVRELVNEALRQINIGKNSTFKYAKSDMLYYDNYYEDSFYVDNTTNIFTLSNSLNKIKDIQNHIQVWVYDYNGTRYVWRPLERDVDYTVSVDILTLNFTPTLDGSSTPAQLKVNWYKTDNNSFVPPSTVKLGFEKAHTVEIRGNILYMHDGSSYECTGTEFYDPYSSDFDVVAAALLDLDLRIYNNLVSEHENVYNLSSLLPNPHINNISQDWNDTRVILDDWYNRWAEKNNVNGFNDASYYDVNDKFTWNYSSVGPGIGGWRGIYFYYFKSDRPDWWPWRMLGHNTKPAWWDTYYSWTDPTKRAALIAALDSGLVNPITNTYDINFAYKNYDFNNNTLVTTTGTLNDPVTANVVTAPSAINASKNFEFGDWGPYEDAWRRTSDCQFALVDLAMTLKPFKAHETFWKMNYISENTALATKYKQLFYTEERTINSLVSNSKIHLREFQDGIIDELEIISGGTGYNNSSIVEFTSNYIKPAQVALRVSGGSVVAASILDPGEGYNFDITSSVSGPLGSGGAEIKGLVNDGVKETILGLNNVIVEWATDYGVHSDDITTMLNKTKAQMMLHVGGYTDSNILEVSIDSSYQNGRVSIPSQDYSIVLNKSAPVKSIFYSGVKVSKDSGKYTVTGFNQNNRTFTHVLPSKGGTTVKEEVGNLSIARYLKYSNTQETISYGTVFSKRQDLYNFLLGLGEYYEQQGFRVSESWRSDAKRVVEWSLSADDGDEFTVNGYDNSIVFEQGTIGFVENTSVIYDGTSNIIDSDNNSVSSKDMLILRSDTSTEFSKKDGTQIYGLRVNVVEYEHVISFSNVTQFNDLIFDPVLGIAQNRIKLEGERTRNWNGKIEAPGYLVRTAGIVKNLESSVREIERDYVNSQSKALSKLTRQTSRFNVGYSQPTYLTNTFVEDNTAYEFGKGLRNYKGTKHTIDSFLKNKNLFATVPSHLVSEEWMIRMGDYGDKKKRDPIEVELSPDLVRSNPQSIKFSPGTVYDIPGDEVIDISATNNKIISGFKTDPFDTLPSQFNNNTSLTLSQVFEDHLKTSGLPLETEVDIKLKSVDNLQDAYDPTADYANISTWRNDVSYKIGDQVRYEGKVYQCLVNSTGLTNVNDPITSRGTKISPTIPSTTPNISLVLNGTSINFYKTATSTLFDTIVVDGTETNPTAPNGSTVIIDGVTIEFLETQTLTNYAPITVTGTVGNPVITGTPGETLIIDGTAVNFTETVSNTVNVSALSAISSAIEPHLASGSSTTLATNYINAWNNLRTTYISLFSESDWINFLVNDYFTGTYVNTGWNTTEASNNSASSFGAEMTAVANAEYAIYNAIYGTSLTPFTALPQEADLISKLTSSQNFLDWVALLKLGGQVLTSTTVSSSTTTAAREWTTDEIVQEINDTLTAAGNTVTVASKEAVTNRLKIVKTASASSTSLIIGAGGSNTEVGFPVTSTTYDSVVTTTVQGRDATVTEISDTINNASIVGVNASVVNNVLRLQSSNQTMVIGAGTANADIGLGQGTYTPSQQSTTTVPVELQLFDVVQQINTSGITGVTAANVNNVVVITCTEPTLTIGDDSVSTANTYLGLISGTYTGETAVSNTFDSTEWQEVVDPAIQNIMVIDNIGSSQDYSRLNGYMVYQVMDFGIEIDEICAGEESGDDALIKLGGNYNITRGDYVMVLNSACLPEIDGIHQVTGTQTDSITGLTQYIFVDEFIEDIGYGGKLLLVRPVRFNNNVDMENTLSSNRYVIGTNGWLPDMYAYVDNVFETVITYDSNNNQIQVQQPTNVGGVYQAYYDTDIGGMSFNKIRSQNITKADNTKIANVKVYNPETNANTHMLEVFDPAKGILPGVAKAEIDLIQDTDIAEYNSTTDENFTTSDITYWGKEKVGTVWWDINNAVYWEYEQGSQAYMQSKWGELYPTSTIDVYEWTKSPVLPDQYADAVASGTIVDGVELTGEPYFTIDIFNDIAYYWSDEIVLNPKTNQEETYYYFWVKNKTTKPNKNRKYSVNQISNIIENPESFGFNWCAAAGTDTIMLSNLSDLLSYPSSVVQVNFRNDDIDLHREYILLGEDDPTVVIPEWLHIGLRDSISGASENIVTAQYLTWQNSVSYDKFDIVKGPDGYFYSAKDFNTGQTPASSLDYWKRIYGAVDNPDGVFDTSNVVQYNSPLAVPDFRLHRLAQYGNMVRPRQSWFKDVQEARRVLVDKLNRQFLNINLVDTVKDWGTVLNSIVDIDGYQYDIRKYWKWADWVAPGYTPGSSISYSVPRAGDLTTGELGEYVRVQISQDGDGVNREQVFEYTTHGWQLVYKQKGTIQFTDLLWNYGKHDYGWDNGAWDYQPWDISPAGLLFNILDTIRNTIFIGQFKSYYTDMWFTMLNYVNSEQNNLDWAFKSTYIKMYIKHTLEKQTSLFVVEREQDLFDFINNAKPFHTKLRDTLFQRDADDEVNLTITSSHDPVITLRYNDHSDSVWSENILSGGGFADTPTGNIDYSTFVGNGATVELTTTSDNNTITVDNTQILSDGSTTVTTIISNVTSDDTLTTSDSTELLADGSSLSITNLPLGYVYEGNSFAQPEYMGHAPEHYVASINEAVEIKVDTNRSGSTVDTDSRSFRMFMDNRGRFESSIIKLTAEIASDVSSTDTSIELTDTSMFTGGHSQVWINGELIEFSNIENNTLIGCIRGIGGTSNRRHSGGDTVYLAGWETIIPAQSNISDYGDHITPAYNDFGKSITDNTSASIEAKFIWDNG